MKQSAVRLNKPKKQNAVSPLSLMIPRDLKVKLMRQSQANFRSMNQHVIFLLSGFTEPMKSELKKKGAQV